MSTPTSRRGRGVYAPFKSPLRPNSINQVSRSLEPNSRTSGSNDDGKHKTTPVSTGKLDFDSHDGSVEEEIELLRQRLMTDRTEPLDLDEELAVWRGRMHAYNEAKDACLQLFGLLAHAKGCLVRDLYSQFGLDLDD